jgi:hypothetical protein
MLNSLPGEFRPVRWYQDVGIHRPLLGHDSCASTLKISLREPLADRLQFVPTLCARLWISHFKAFKRIEDNP